MSQLRDAAVVFVVKDVMRDFTVEDLDGNHLNFGMESRK